MSDIQREDAGVASDMVNTSFMMGGALGLAVLASLAEARTAASLAAGAVSAVALNDGYQLAFGVGAVCALTAAGLGTLLLRDHQAQITQQAVNH